MRANELSEDLPPHRAIASYSQPLYVKINDRTATAPRPPKNIRRRRTPVGQPTFRRQGESAHGAPLQRAQIQHLPKIWGAQRIPYQLIGNPLPIADRPPPRSNLLATHFRGPTKIWIGDTCNPIRWVDNPGTAGWTRDRLGEIARAHCAYRRCTLQTARRKRNAMPRAVCQATKRKQRAMVAGPRTSRAVPNTPSIQ